MDEAKPCCRTTPERPRATSPFDEIIVLGFSDGPTEGLLRCGGCGREYRFQLLDSRPESPDGDDLRIFGLSGIPKGSMASFRAAMSPHQRPKGPLWVPIWSFPTDGVRDEMNDRVDRIYASAGPVEWAFACSMGLTGELLTCRSISVAETIARKDWFETLGLAKSTVAD